MKMRVVLANDREVYAQHILHRTQSPCDSTTAQSHGNGLSLGEVTEMINMPPGHQQDATEVLEREPVVRSQVITDNDTVIDQRPWRCLGSPNLVADQAVSGA